MSSQSILSNRLDRSDVSVYNSIDFSHYLRHGSHDCASEIFLQGCEDERLNIGEQAGDRPELFLNDLNAVLYTAFNIFQSVLGI